MVEEINACAVRLMDAALTGVGGGGPRRRRDTHTDPGCGPGFDFRSGRGLLFAIIIILPNNLALGLELEQLLPGRDDRKASDDDDDDDVQDESIGTRLWR